MPERDSLKFQYLEEQYETLTNLSEKPDGQVFLARDKSSGRIVVKKYVSSETALLCERLCGIRNRYLANVYETAADKNRGIIIEAYISGSTLQNAIEERGLFAEKEVLSVMTGLCEALELIHNMGMVHRDINPNNIMLSEDGVVKLIDLGIAREVKSEKGQDTAILGTMGYAAPEQFGFRQTDERTDIYALGVLMNVMLTGKLPTELRYSKETVLGTAIRRCLEIDPEKRFQTIGQLQEQLSIRVSMGEEKEKTVYKGCQVAWLPGFRTGVLWKNIVASIGYGMMVLGTYVMVEPCAQSMESFLLEMLAVFLYMWMAVLIAVNAGSWDRKLPGFRSFPRMLRIVLRIVFAMLIFECGIKIEDYVKTALLGLPVM
ncbi:MAG: serine/threonine protein kinase [Bacteroidales bacterium]|nr:serine/threonine protein kinase [Bacteroidales bacterium]MCM1416848.1 serine/threonine protein kinase [bacterium]MCM1423977.1 serine/threonine protein kinase [bacterium]